MHLSELLPGSNREFLLFELINEFFRENEDANEPFLSKTADALRETEAE